VRFTSDGISLAGHIYRPPAAGEMATVLMTEVRGASNAKAKRELGWQPKYPSWRQGLTSGSIG
jgi:nucleoside-diphosphate-sugar epimerase